MNKNLKNNTEYYFSGGFAEIVSQPSRVTYSFFREWFTGQGSLGLAMDTLGLPYEKSYRPILDLFQGELLVNLLAEEEVLYRKTIFRYKRQASIHKTPELTVAYHKILLPINLFNTAKILLKQSEWISRPMGMVSFAKSQLQRIPQPSKTEPDVFEIEHIIAEKVWPPVIVIGILSEFYYQLLQHETNEQFVKLQEYISRKVAKDDWYFKSFSDRLRVKNGQMSFDKYVSEYGMRSDKDYELLVPRWHEEPEKLKRTIQDYDVRTPADSDASWFDRLDNKTKQLTNTVIELQLLRSEAKKMTLPFINQLRQVIMTEFDLPVMKGLNDASEKSHGGIVMANMTDAESKNLHNISERKGIGTGISVGAVSGVVKHIRTTSVEIKPNTIGIFPNASPEFSTQYPKCKGMIFLRGGQTSHGATVAREFGIPALIDENGSAIPDGCTVHIDGEKGTWYIAGDDNVSVKSEKKEVINTDSAVPEIVELTSVTKKDIQIVGGKAASLGELLGLGFRVPRGLVLTTEVYKKYAKGGLPKELLHDLEQRCQKLTLSNVAVRSSATFEDSNDNSWAGQLDTFLAVDSSEVKKSIEKCWSSIKSQRAAEYAKKSNIDPSGGIAVIIQEMIAGEISGVVFTSNPVSNDHTEMVIEAVYGLGEMLVDGKVSPTRYVINKRTGIVKKITPQPQRTMYIATDNGIKEVPVDRKNNHNTLLSQRQVDDIVSASRQIEKHYHLPQDIEWTLKNNTLYILQSRAITTKGK